MQNRPYNDIKWWKTVVEILVDKFCMNYKEHLWQSCGLGLHEPAHVFLIRSSVSVD